MNIIHKYYCIGCNKELLPFTGYVSELKNNNINISESKEEIAYLICHNKKCKNFDIPKIKIKIIIEK